METDQWTLVWSDEFDGPVLDPTRWRVEVGYTGESNGEREIYTARPENLFLQDSCLALVAREEEYQGGAYTSARITTYGLHSWMYGRVEARIKISAGAGLWPAFWMLGEDIDRLGWPECGEIDIMENIGVRPDMVRGTLHGPGYFRDDSIGQDFILPGQRFADHFHQYAIEWQPGQIRWFVDGHGYSTLSATDVPGRWVFDQPFFIILNNAVGGFWPGYPDKTTHFPQPMLVDYVRIYQNGLFGAYG